VKEEGKVQDGRLNIAMMHPLGVRSKGEKQMRES